MQRLEAMIRRIVQEELLTHGQVLLRVLETLEAQEGKHDDARTHAHLGAAHFHLATSQPCAHLVSRRAGVAMSRMWRCNQYVTPQTDIEIAIYANCQKV